jgi:hypothetical protein
MTRIEELEHDGTEQLPAIAPLGQDPDHCERCREVRWTRERQAACSHPEDEIERVEITQMGDVGRHYLAHCGACGKPMEDA